MSWVSDFTPVPPPVLAERVEALVGPRMKPGQTAPGPDEYMDAADALLQELLRDDSTSRASAIDLLVVDALVTYAFEAASDEPGRVAARAADAMRRIASRAGPTTRPNPA
jgi:hypothetical protein